MNSAYIDGQLLMVVKIETQNCYWLKTIQTVDTVGFVLIVYIHIKVTSTMHEFLVMLRMICLKFQNIKINHTLTPADGS